MKTEQFEELKQRMDRIERILFQMNQSKEVSHDRLGDPTDLIGIKEAAELLKISKGGLYNLCSQGKIKRYKRHRKLFFSKKYLIEYIKESPIN